MQFAICIFGRIVLVCELRARLALSPHASRHRALSATKKWMPIWLHSLGGQLYQKSPHFKELLANALLCNINLAKATNKVCMVENNEYEFIHTKSTTTSYITLSNGYIH